MTRLSEFWSARSTREQAMLLIAAALAAVLLFSLGVVSPALKWREASNAAAQARKNDYLLVSAAAQRASGKRRAPQSDTPIRTALAQSAAAAGAELSFVNLRDDGSIEVQINSTAPDKLFLLLKQLDEQYAINVSTADVARVSEGSSEVRAQLTLVR